MFTFVFSLPHKIINIMSVKSHPRAIGSLIAVSYCHYSYLDDDDQFRCSRGLYCHGVDCRFFKLYSEVSQLSLFV